MAKKDFIERAKWNIETGGRLGRKLSAMEKKKRKKAREKQYREEHPLYDELLRETSKFNRMAGQYKRLYGITDEMVQEIWENARPIKNPKRATQKSIDRIKRAQDELRALAERIKNKPPEPPEGPDDGYKIMLDNFIEQLREYINANRSSALRDMERSFEFIREILREAEEKHGAKFVVEKLSEWTENFIEQMGRLVAAIYDPEYRLDYSSRDSGRDKYIEVVGQLQTLLEVSVPMTF